MKSSDVSNALTGIIALCCLVLTGTALQRQFFAPAPRSVVMGPEAVPDWSSYARDGQRMGPASARVTITEFSDYQCPFCKKFNTVLHQVRAAHPNDVAVVYRHFPLRQHEYARTAALASECAAAQGRFEAFTDTLYAAQGSIGERRWTAFASAAGIRDTIAFSTCVRDSTYDQRIRRDEAEGKRLKAHGTPTVLVNGWRVNGPLTLDVIEKLVSQELAGGQR